MRWVSAIAASLSFARLAMRLSVVVPGWNQTGTTPDPQLD
jgi:hypothetical protein